MGAQTATEKAGLADISRNQRTLALAGVIATLLAVTLNQALSIPALPRAIAGLNGFARYSWPSTSFLLTSTIAMPVFAKLSDIYGRKWFYLFGAALCLAYEALCGSAGALPILTDGMSQLIAGTSLGGLGSAAITVISFTL